MVYFLTRNPITLENVAGATPQPAGDTLDHADQDQA
jgi:hypothetical protein